MVYNLETKNFKFTILENDEEGGVFTGYASVWDVVDAYGDKVKKGAFKKTIKERKRFPLLWSHNVEEVIGVVELEEDDYGLKVKRGELNLEVQRARELRSLIMQGAVDGLSIGYQTVKCDYEKGDEGKTIRVLQEIKLWEVSLCVFPANEPAKVDDIKSGAMDDVELEKKPYPNEHACRLREPSEFEEGSFRRVERETDGKKYGVIMGKLKEGGSWAEQAYRYKKDEWEKAEAKKHCEDHGGKFEPAAEKNKECEECRAEAEPDEEKSTQAKDVEGRNPDLIVQYLLNEEMVRAIKLKMLWRD